MPEEHACRFELNENRVEVETNGNQHQMETLLETLTVVLLQMTS